MKISKELKEWIILITVVGVLFLTGWYKDVAGLLQRGLLETGLIQPDTEIEKRRADYNFDLINEEGETVNFSSFQEETVFMNIWATWCPPCIAEMPDISDLYEKMGDDVKFVMISVDEEPTTALAFIKSKGFDFPVYFLKSGLPQPYSSQSIPTTYVISPEGKIVSEHRGMAKYDTEKFRNFLKELTQLKRSS